MQKRNDEEWDRLIGDNPLIELTILGKDGSPCTERFRANSLRGYAKSSCRTCWGRGYCVVELRGETRNEACRCTNRRIRWGFGE